MEPWIIWLTIAALLLITEILTQMMWALCLTAGAVAALALSLAGAGTVWQVAALLAVGLGTYAAVLPRFRRWHARQAERQARTGMDALLGRRAVVTESILPGRLGRARIDGDNWQVQAPGIADEIPAGAEVSVDAYDSIILTVSDPSETKPL